MDDLNEDLFRFARSIVNGCEIPAQISTVYPNYSVDTAVEVYRNNYRGNLHDSLAGAYPVIKQLVGDDFFRFMTRSYIGQHPSASANLLHYGDKLANFLASFTPVQELVYLPDVAKLEWACHQAYFAPDQPRLSLVGLAQIPSEHYPDLILQTDCCLIRSNYPIVAIWQAHQVELGGEFHIDLNSGPCIAQVVRRDGVVRVSELSCANACWLQCIQAGQTLGAATAATLEKYPDLDLQGALLGANLTGFHYKDAL